MAAIFTKTCENAMFTVFHWLSQILFFKRNLPLSPSERSDITSRAHHILSFLKDNKYEEALDTSNYTLRLVLRPRVLAKVFKDLHTKHGEIVSFSNIDVEASSALGNGITRAAKFVVKFERIDMLAVITFDYMGNLAGIRFKSIEDVAIGCEGSEDVPPRSFVEE